MRWLAVLALAPAFSLGADFSDVSALEARLTSLEKRVEALEGKAKCPCPDGECICKPGECDCPNCPKHVQGNTDARVRILAWHATWCGPCRQADSETEAAGLYDKVIHYDWDRAKDRATGQSLGVSQLPTLLLIKDEKVIDRHVGSTGYVEQIREWLKSPEKRVAGAGVEIRNRGPVPAARSYDDGDASDEQIRQHLVDAHGYSWSQVNGMSRSQLKAAHDNAHGGPSLVSKNYPVRRSIRYIQPAYYQPRVYYQPSYGSCPNCAR